MRLEVFLYGSFAVGSKKKMKSYFLRKKHLVFSSFNMRMEETGGSGQAFEKKRRKKNKGVEARKN